MSLCLLNMRVLLPLALCVLGILGSVAEPLTLVLEHKLADVFEPAASLHGLQADSETHTQRLTLQWQHTKSSHVSQLNQLAKDDKLYTMRVKPPAAGTAPGVMFSMPAACFAAALRDAHRLDVRLGPAGELVGLDLRHHASLQCTGELAAWPARTDAKVVMPVPGVDMSTVDEAPEGGKQQPDPQLAQAMTQAQGDQGAGDGKKPQKEKTFWEKNWLFMLAGGMLLLNVLGPKPPQQQAAAPAAAR